MSKKNKAKMMRQCKLERKEENTIVRKVGWIDSKASVVGKVLTLKEEEHKFHWTVKEVSTSQHDYETVKKMSDAHRHQRKASDI